MKSVGVQNGVVVSVGQVFSADAIIVHASGVTVFEVSDETNVATGWACAVDASGNPTFTALQTYTPNTVSIGQFLASLTGQERSALRLHADPLVKEFVAICTDPRITAIDLNLPSIQFDIKYAAGLVAAPTGAANAGQPIANPPIGGQVRADAILAGNALAATN